MARQATHMSFGLPEYPRFQQVMMGHVRDFARTAPLLAAVLAPFAVLLDIPALSESWYTVNGVPQPDPRACLILSGFGLAFSIIANALLIFRFSSEDRTWRIATWCSVFCWLVKVAFATGNLITFGALTGNASGNAFSEGFWCAVVSDATSVIILGLLLLHFCYEFMSKKRKEKQTLDVRVAGRHFMLQTTSFIAVIAIASLVFSRIESWTYLQGIYFIIVSFLTIGFGDFEVTTTLGRILLFPFCLLGIALLGSLLQLIIQFFSDRAAERKALSRAEFERKRQLEENARQDSEACLGREIEFLHTMNANQDLWDEVQDFAVSCGGFCVFWVVGAAIFSQIEGWTYGTGLYFCYVVFFTTGYGDVVPQSPAGRVIFIVYSLLAVPIMASFAVQAVTQVITRISLWRLNERQAATGVDATKANDIKPPPSHAEYVERFSRKWEDTLRNSSYAQDEGEKERLMHEVMKQAIELEQHARRLLINHLPNGSKAQVVLKADRNVQLRDVRKIRRRYTKEGTTEGHEAKEKSEGGKTGDAFGDPDTVSKPLSEEETLDEVNMYRESFASLLAAGSRMKGLEGRERYLMERRDEGKDQQEGRGKDREVANEKKGQEATL